MASGYARVARITAKREAALGQLVRTDDIGKMEGMVGVGGDRVRQKKLRTTAVLQAPASNSGSLAARIEQEPEGKWRGVRGGLIGGLGSWCKGLKRCNSSSAGVTPRRRNLRPNVEDDPVSGDVTMRNPPGSERKRERGRMACWAWARAFAGLAAHARCERRELGQAQLGWLAQLLRPLFFFLSKTFFFISVSKTEQTKLLI